MHTFFINTSKKRLDGYEVLFDIHQECKSLVSIDCPLDKWYSENAGYQSCIDQMSDLIDGYVELNNAFNLIIYIDLPENETYASVRRDELHDIERNEYGIAMHILYTHLIKTSIVAKLNDSGRRPQSVLIMFGEEKEFLQQGTVDGKIINDSVMKKLSGYLGLPDQQEIENIARSLKNEDAETQKRLLKQKLGEVAGKELLPGIRETYSEALGLWYGQIVTSADVAFANEELYKNIREINRVEAIYERIENVSCPYDCFACRVNKSALALSKLNIAIYVLQCVEAGTIYGQETDEEGNRMVLPFCVYKADTLAPLLIAKKAIYSQKADALTSQNSLYRDMELLAQPLAKFAHERFGLDCYGEKAVELVIMDDLSEKEDQKDKEKDKKKDKKSPDAAVVRKKGKKVEIASKNLDDLLRLEGYPLFDYQGDQIGMEEPDKKTTPDGYIEHATMLRKHHLNYLKALKLHITRVLSNYAGKSKENHSALLQSGKAMYSAAGKEDRVLEEVESIAERAYQTVMDQYMHFCAARSVAVTDIEDECNKFATEVRQIEDSLRRLKLVAIGLLGALLTLYVPFVIIQYEAIVENLLTIAVAVGALSIPVLLLATVFSIAAARQKRRFGKAWEEFKKRSDAIGKENAVAAKRFDQLLATVIPALRWVYEYKCEVENFAESCEIADAKKEHHRRKLRDRVSAIENILGDLEHDPAVVSKASSSATGKPGKDGKEIDYAVSFCTGEKNRRFYSIVGKDFFAPKQA